MILVRHGQSEFNAVYSVTRVDPGIPDPQLTDIGRARRIVRNVRADELNGLVLPFGWEFSLVASSGGAGAADTDMVISRRATGFAGCCYPAAPSRWTMR